LPNPIWNWKLGFNPRDSDGYMHTDWQIVIHIVNLRFCEKIWVILINVEVFYSNFDPLTFTLVVVELMNVVVVENTWIKGFTFGSFKARKVCHEFQYDWEGCDILRIQDNTYGTCLYPEAQFIVFFATTMLVFSIIILLLEYPCYFCGIILGNIHILSTIKASFNVQTWNAQFHTTFQPSLYSLGFTLPLQYDFHSIYKWEIEFLYCIWISFLSKRNS